MKLLYSILQEALGPKFWTSNELRSDVRRLHLSFTEHRDQLTKNYMNVPAAQRAYLAYYLPLNFEKILFLLRDHQKHVLKLLKQSDSVRVLDYGCGPGTAGIAFLEFLSEQKNPPREVHLHFVDGQTKALQTCKKLTTRYLEEQRGRTKIIPHFLPKTPANMSFDLIFASNVLNEMDAETDAKNKTVNAIEELWENTHGAFLILEPSHRVSSQKLIRMRERLLEASKSRKEPFSILGPCTHLEKCPLFRSQHWCHFSEKVHPKSPMIDLNLGFFQNPRIWMKFSYLFLTKQPHELKPNVYRAIGDLHESGPKFLSIDLCQPNQKLPFKVPRQAPRGVTAPLNRGALVELTPDKSRIAGGVKIKPVKTLNPVLLKKG